MSWEHIDLALEDDVALVTLNRPDALNAFAGTMREDLHQAISQGAERARVVVITGAGKAFSSGGDVRVMAKLRRARDAKELRRLVRLGKDIARLMSDLPVPTVAAINGVAAGAGLALALLCDLRVASRRARLGAGFAKIGLHPDWGASFFLPRLVGDAVAKDLVFSGRLVDADEALRLGLVSQVLDDKAFLDQVRELARELAAMPPAALRLAKQSIHNAAGASLEAALDAEEEAQLFCFGTEDALEGITAFEEKRPPRFRGR